MKKISIRYLLIFLSILLSFATIGVASYVVQTGALSTENKNVSDGDNTVTITVKYMVYDNLKETSTTLESQDWTVTDSTNYTALKNHANTYIDIVEIPYFNNPGTTTTLNNGDYLITNEGEYKGYYFCISNSSCKITVTSSCNSTKTSYDGSCTTSIVKKDMQYEYSLFSDNSYDETITCKKDYKFNANYIKSKLHLFTEDTKYSFLYFKSVNSDGTLGEEIINEGTTISSNITICAVINNNQSTTLNRINITDLISNSSSALNIYKGSSSADVSKDFSFTEEINSFSIGKSGSDLIIKSGADIKLCLNDGSAYTLANSKSSNSGSIIEAEDASKIKQYTACLNSDLIIEDGGNLSIGAYLGKGGSNNQQGHINGDYVCLDLMGNDLIVRGKLLSYGLIKDSIGTGRIIVEGGIVTTPTTIMDYKGGTNTKNLQSAKVFPFMLYHIPYLRAKTIIKFNSKTGKWGGLIGILQLCLQTTININTHETVNIRFIGNDANYFFQFINSISSYDESYLELNSYLTQATETELSNNYQSNALRRLSWTFRNVAIKNNSISLSIAGVSVNTSDYIFPLSPYMEIFLVNSIFAYNQKLQFMSGSKLYADENSEIYLGDNAIVQVNGKNVGHYTNNNNTFLSTDSILSNGSFGHSEYYFNQPFNKYYQESEIYIFGKTIIAQGSSVTISGRFNFGRIYVKDSSGNIIELTSSNPFLELKNTYATTVKTYDYSYSNLDSNRDHKGYALPLISYDIAYLNDSSLSYVGTFDTDEGIFRSGDALYFFDIGTTFSLRQTRPMSLINITEGNIDSLYKKIMYNGTTYVYFSGIYFPFTVGSSDTTGSINVGAVNSNVTSINVSYNSSYNMWLRV